MAGAVINTINTRLDAAAIAFILQHGEARVLLTDREFSRAIAPALASLEKAPLVVDIDDRSVESGELLGAMDYEAFLATGDPEFEWRGPADEWQTIALNYTSGTTGNPKGCVSHHRGAYLNAITNVLFWEMSQRPVYLWTLPMFHCNGWCLPWTLALVAGTSVCLRSVRADRIFALLREEKVTHLSAAPVVLATLSNAPPSLREGLPPGIKVMTGAAAPPPALLERMERLGFQVTHGYGLTESYGPATMCAWQPEWAALPVEDRARHQARQGVRTPMLEAVMVADPTTLAPVPRDGRTVGEVFLRGNTIMKGYLKNPAATEEVFRGGWLHTGDLAVCHPDDYIEIVDRSKDMIISGGENISSLEVEAVLYRHPAVLDAAGGGDARRQVGREPVRLHRPARRGDRRRARPHLVLPAAPGALQGAQEHRLRPGAQDRDRQDPEGHPARARPLAGPAPLARAQRKRRASSPTTAAAEGEHAEDEDAALAHRHPGAERGEDVLEGDHDQRARPADRSPGRARRSASSG
jgi:fatty-acyl-CoA synthase